MLRRLPILTCLDLIVIFAVLTFILICLEAVTLLEAGEGLDSCLEARLCEAFYDSLFSES